MKFTKFLCIVVLCGLGCREPTVQGVGAKYVGKPDPKEDSPTTGSPTVVEADMEVGSQGEGEGEFELAPEPRVVRFVVLGDAGEGNETQKEVAVTMADVCDALGGCEFALYLGDNFYNSGIEPDLGVDDPQFENKFEVPYRDLGFPFWVVLGNHDYGLVPIQRAKALVQIDYSNESDKWQMPDFFYSRTEGFIDLFALDSNSLMLEWGFVGEADAQLDYFRYEVGQSMAAWKIGFGHHPYLSNGKPGNAGEYEGLFNDGEEIEFKVPNSWPLASQISGERFRASFEDVFCDELDLYFSGHDHNRQWLPAVPACGKTEFVVSGAGAKLTALDGHGNDAFFEDDQDAGFFVFEVSEDKLTGYAYSVLGDMQFERSLNRADGATQ